jgi:hypothetical protein
MTTKVLYKTTMERQGMPSLPPMINGGLLEEKRKISPGRNLSRLSRHDMRKLLLLLVMTLVNPL